MTAERIKGHICILGTNIIFGICIPMLKHLTSGYISGMVLTIFRFWGATILFWIAGLFVKNDKVPPRDIAIMALFGLFAIVLNQGLFILGLQITSPVDASVIVTLTPLIVMLLSAIFLRDPITRRKFLGVGMGAIGALWLVLSTGRIAASSGSWSGDLLILSSGLATALYFTFSKPINTRHSPITVLKWMFLFSSIYCIPATSAIMTAPDAFGESFGASEFAMLAYAICVATFFSYFLMNMAIKRMRPTTLAMYNYIQPFVASCVAITVGQDVFSVEKCCAAVLVFFGVYLVTTSRRAQANE